jgi:hypothetical protein
VPSKPVTLLAKPQSTPRIVAPHGRIRDARGFEAGRCRPSRQRLFARFPTLPHSFRTALPPLQPNKPPNARDAFSPRRPPSRFSRLRHNGEPGYGFLFPVHGG